MTDRSPGSGGRRGARGAAAAAALLLLVGTSTLVLGLRGSDPPPALTTRSGAANAQPPTSPTPDASSTPDSDIGAFLPGSRPTTLTIPAIGVRVDKIVSLGLAPDGSIEVPVDPADPGWFTPGPSPGQLGPSVIAGHVDSKTGPAVFYRLGELRPGDLMTIDREDGSVVTFEVHRVETFDKDTFPTREVYGANDQAELRLITCSGEYDENGGYLGNTVAFAHLVDSA